MSIGEHTKCNLDADKASLDMTTLTVQTERRFYSLIRQIEKKTSEVGNNSMTEEQRKDAVFTMTVHGSQDLLRMTQDLAETAEVLHTLQSLKGRELVAIHTDTKTE